MSLGLNTSLNIASSGLSAVQYELGVASQNVANASTPGYVSEVANVASRQGGLQGDGVVVQLTTRSVNTVLQNSLYAQNATVAGLGVTTNALSAVSSVQGSTSADPGASGTLADDVGNLQDDFTTLESSPDSAAEQDAVVSDASTLANSIQTLSSTYQTQRQNAQSSIVAEVDAVNTSLNAIGTLSKNIMQMQSTGQQTADLENQRSAAMSTLSGYLNVSFTETASGDMLVSTANGLQLPTNASSGPLSTQNVAIGASTAYPASIGTNPAIPPIELGGQDVTTALTGGSLGANITLRDSTLPTMQGQLDSFASTLANRFATQGLTLFTDGSGATPGTSTTATSPTGQVGFSGSIQVSAAVAANPSQVQSGTPPVAETSGSTTLIGQVLASTFGSSDSSLATLASNLTTSQAQTIADATAQQTTQTDIQTTLQGNLTTSSGVSVDDQMSQVVALQNAYEANAKVIAAVQSMFGTLLAAVS